MVLRAKDPVRTKNSKGAQYMRVSLRLITSVAAISFCFLFRFTGAAGTSDSDTWHLDGPHSAAQFSVRHLGISTVRGTFTKVSGDVTYSPADPSKSSMDVTIDASSVDTRVEMRVTTTCAGRTFGT